MSDSLPAVTVIVPTRPGDAEPLAVAAARQLNYPAGKVEILVARGCQPAVQRNVAMESATGDVIYFLDDDSIAPADNLSRAAGHFEDPSVAMVGGPNLCPDDAPELEKCFAAVLSAWLAFGPSRARYGKVGALRATGEKELILCNLLARRSALVAAGGFDETLYPNEENALMDELQKRGGKLLYDPDLFVYRRPRKTLAAFCRMLLNYGRGRAEQFRLHPTPGSALNFVPPLFCFYLAALPVLLATPWRTMALVPMAAYLFAVLVQSVALMRGHAVRHSLAAGPLILVTHVFYGVGFWRGLFTRLKQRATQRAEITLEKITP